MASLLPGLRRAAPRISRDFFVCRQCLNKSRPVTRKTQFLPNTKPLGSVRFNSTTATLPEIVAGKPKSSSPLASLGQTISKRSPQQPKVVPTKAFFPETSSNTVAYWLLGSAVSVFGIVVFGGLTRLTESGYVSSISSISSTIGNN